MKTTVKILIAVFIFAIGIALVNSILPPKIVTQMDTTYVYHDPDTITNTNTVIYHDTFTIVDSTRINALEQALRDSTSRINSLLDLLSEGNVVVLRDSTTFNTGDSLEVETKLDFEKTIWRYNFFPAPDTLIKETKTEIERDRTFASVGLKLQMISGRKIGLYGDVLVELPYNWSAGPFIYYRLGDDTYSLGLQVQKRWKFNFPKIKLF